MAVRRVSPEEALELIDKEGYVYVDVRSVPEFSAGHPAGAVNVPLLHTSAFGMSPNHEFVEVMEKAFPKNAKLVVGCRAGSRSLQAATILQSVGYSNVVEQRGGFEGSGGFFGRGEPGWRQKGFPVSQEAPPENTWDGLRTRTLS
jgi:rhodanese-related sulfurtransferase